MIRDATYWIRKLELLPHPEGGYYRQTYRSALLLPKQDLPSEFPGPRPAATCIYFLLDRNSFSAFHRLRSDELWHFHLGDSLLIHAIAPDGDYSQVRLGSDLDSGETLQAVIRAGFWFAAELAATSVRLLPSQEAFALVSCTVAPGFDFEDFELAKREDLSQCFPQHKELVANLTRT